MFLEEVLTKNYTIVNSILVETKDRPEIKIDWRIYIKILKNTYSRSYNRKFKHKKQKEEFNSVLQSNNNEIGTLNHSVIIKTE